MEGKKEFIRFIKYIGICFMAVLLAVGGFVLVTDPFYHYHSPWFQIPVVLENAVYQTPGAARNLAYDSAIVGTSMTENMHTSWFNEELGWNTMKLSYSGARTDDLKAIFDEMNDHAGTLKNVVLDINEYQLRSDSRTSYVERPAYLYDENLWNDYKYLLNRDVVTAGVKRCMNGLLNESDNVDRAYTWEEEIPFGEEIVKEEFVGTRSSLIWERYQQYGEEGLYMTTGQVTENYEQYVVSGRENLENILPFIAEHPDTQFHIIIPPYSIIYWEEKILAGDLENVIGMYLYMAETLLQYDNVNLYYFQHEPDIITNLDNYRDSCHHRPEYNRYIFECIRDGKKQMTLENYQELFAEMYYFAKDYPYTELWAE